jgi:diguanylate cyclase (GGDEF)-like protein
MFHTFTRTLWKLLSLLLVGTGLFLAYLLLKPVPTAQFTFGDNLLQSALEVVALLGYLLLGLVARSLYVLPQLGQQIAEQAAGSERTAKQPALWQTLLPYAWVPTVGVLLLFIWRRGGAPFLVLGVVVGAVVLVGLVLVRQLVAMRELHDLYVNNDALAAANRQLEVQATHDSLTSLPNRNLLQRRIEQATHLARKGDISAALLILDLDRFKEVNDTIGHQRGDQLLQQVGERLRQAVSATATVARLGGDEFAVFLPGADEAGARQVVSALVRTLEEPFLVEEYPLHVEASVGVALYPAHGSEPLTLFQHADVAMYTAKRGHEWSALYDASRDQYSPRRLTLLGDLRKAIAAQELRLYYQPKAEMQTGLVKGVEALVRWQHPTLGFIPPDQFIPLAEQTGLIEPLTHWVVETAIEQCRHWLDGGLELRVAVNLSMRNLRDTNLPDTIESLLAQHGVPPHLLCCEITESAVMGDAEHTLQVLNRLFALGVRIAIDDYGTGYASLSYLKRLPADELKIDRAFVQHMTTDRADQAIVRSTVNMAHSLGIHVVAEGVEDQATWDLLETLRCDIAQGYYLSRPIPAQDLERWLGERKEAAARWLDERQEVAAL